MHSIARRAGSACALSLALIAVSSRAEPVTVATPFFNLDRVGANSIGSQPGDYMRIGANTVLPNGGDGTIGVGSTIDLNTGQRVERSIGWLPSPLLPNFFQRYMPADTGLFGAWSLAFTNGANTTTVTVPALPTGTSQAPFVNNLTMSGTRESPVFNWTPPPGASVQGYRVNIQDKTLISPTNSGLVVSMNLQPDVTTYQVRAQDFQVPGYGLTPGRDYVIQILTLQTRDGSSTNLSNTNLKAIARSYAEFTPIDTGGQPVNLPVQRADGTYQYNLDVRPGVVYQGLVNNTGSNSASGYDYAIGSGDPRFRSVVLPAFGDGRYDILGFDAVGNPIRLATDWSAGTAFDFGAAGVDRFRVLGIEAPGSGAASSFLTAFTFTGAGLFTGTQAPIGAFSSVGAPPAALLALLAFALGPLRRASSSIAQRRSLRRSRRAAPGTRGVARRHHLHEETRMRSIARCAVSACALSLGLIAASSRAEPVTVTSPFFNLERRGVNSFGWTPGDYMRIGADSVRPNGAGGTTGLGSTVDLNTGQRVERSVDWLPGPVQPDFFVRRIPANTSLFGAWSLAFTNGANTTTVTVPALPTGTAQAPFVNNLSMSGSRESPVFSWAPPAGAGVQGYRVNIYDKALVSPTNLGNVVSINLQPSVTTYQVRAQDFQVPGYGFTPGRDYVIEISTIQTRDGASTNLGNANLKAIARSYAEFTPIDTGGQPVNLPVQRADGTYQYNLDVRPGVVYQGLVNNTGSNSASGYDYAIGSGDPRFRSVVLPAFGDGRYDILGFDAVGNPIRLATDWSAGTAFDFGAAGVDRFRVLGIEAPGSGAVSSFLTGFSFTGAGLFTGTQAPIGAFSPVGAPPAALLGLLAFALGPLRRGRRAR